MHAISEEEIGGRHSDLRQVFMSRVIQTKPLAAFHLIMKFYFFILTVKPLPFKIRIQTSRVLKLGIFPRNDVFKKFSYGWQHLSYCPVVMINWPSLQILIENICMSYQYCIIISRVILRFHGLRDERWVCAVFS